MRFDCSPFDLEYFPYARGDVEPEPEAARVLGQYTGRFTSDDAINEWCKFVYGYCLVRRAHHAQQPRAVPPVPVAVFASGSHAQRARTPGRGMQSRPMSPYKFGDAPPDASAVCASCFPSPSSSLPFASLDAHPRLSRRLDVEQRARCVYLSSNNVLVLTRDLHRLYRPSGLCDDEPRLGHARGRESRQQ